MAQSGAAPGGPDVGSVGGPPPESSSGSESSGGPKDKGQVVDADFEVVDSDKKA
jgi:hypothetical protein